jgi:hypothetical protein
MLALGSDEELKAIARRELENADDPDEQAELGDDWWDLAKQSKGATRRNLLVRTFQRYQQSADKLTGLAKAKATKRLEQIKAEVPDLASLIGQGDGQLAKATPAEIPAPDTPVGRAINGGLQWLVSHQHSSGAWSYLIPPNPGTLDECVAAPTAMALIPLLRAGHTHETGAHKRSVSMGLTFLSSRMKIGPTGGSFAEPEARMYGHGMAAIAICEAYARTRDRRLGKGAQMAVNYIIYCQDPVGGGWRYSPRQSGDTSVTGWQFTALALAKEAGLQVPSQTIAGVSKFLNGVQADGGANYGYTGPSVGRDSTTAIGLLCRTKLGWDKDNPALQKGVQYLVAQGPSNTNMYYNYYASQVMADWGGAEGKKWCKEMSENLLRVQGKTDDTTKGSWYVLGSDHGASRGGRLYMTTMALMTLQNCARCAD